MSIFIRNILMIITILFFVNFNYASAIDSDTEDNKNENYSELIALAREKAVNAGVNIDSCEIKITNQNGFTVVEFLQTKKNVVGGEARLFFKKNGSEYKFVRGELLQ